jgi:hypothetical protein
MLVHGRTQLRADNPDVFKSPSLIDVETSIDSLAPDSPILPVLLAAPRPPWVRHHTIIGVVPDKGILGSVVGEGDGVVSFTSAHLEDADSEIVVSADHTTIHSHPLSVLEVHRILLAHLAEVDAEQRGRWPRMPMTASAQGPAGTHWTPERAAPPLQPPSAPVQLPPVGPPVEIGRQR